MKEDIIIINRKSTDSDKAINYFRRMKIKTYVFDNEYYLENKLKECFKKGHNSYIICGGDGTLNKFINISMKYNVPVKIGIIPSGRANDLARHLRIPFDTDNAYNLIKKRRIKHIDVIKVNDNYFLTGGGFGLVAEVIGDVNKRSSKKSNKMLKEIVYYISVIKKMIFSYDGTNVEGIRKKLMFYAIGNQDFIGKRFRLTPKASNDDGYFDICHVTKPKGILSNLIILRKIIHGNHIGIGECFYDRKKSLELKLIREEWFMADGELLEKNRAFKFSVMPKGIRVYY